MENGHMDRNLAGRVCGEGGALQLWLNQEQKKCP